MARTYRQLDLDERRTLFRLVEARIPIGEIAERLGINAGAGLVAEAADLDAVALDRSAERSGPWRKRTVRERRDGAAWRL